MTTAPAAAVDNPAWLKLDLYCKGLRLDDSCFVEQDGGRQILRTRAGLGSGLELILPGGLWTNVPVAEGFARHSPYTLHRTDGRYRLRRDGHDVAPVTLSPRPRWYEEKTSSGKPRARVGTLQGTYLGIYQAKVCEYWTAKPQKSNCKFCSVGLNLGIDDADEKSVDEVMEVPWPGTGSPRPRRDLGEGRTSGYPASSSRVRKRRITPFIVSRPTS